MPEVKQAAERLRRSMASTVYGENARMREKDIAAVVQAYLAEHAADDDEPITREWWNALANNEHCFVWLDGGTWLEWTEPHGVSLEGALESISLRITTRGQIRLLLRALQ